MKWAAGVKILSLSCSFIILLAYFAMSRYASLYQKQLK